MKCLVVHAHPLQDSLNAHLARCVVEELEAAGHEVDFLDLYAIDFDPRLSAAECAVHHDPQAASRAAPDHAGLLAACETVILVFPTWWFGLPAMLKGWIDRTFAPGIAFDHGDNGGPIKARLHGLRHMVAITTLGSPWWVDTFVMRRPVRKMLKTGILLGCAPKARFDYVALHNADSLREDEVARFRRRIASRLGRIGSA